MIWWILLILSAAAMTLLIPFGALVYGEVREPRVEPMGKVPVLPEARLTGREYRRLVNESRRRRLARYGRY